MPAGGEAPMPAGGEAPMTAGGMSSMPAGGDECKRMLVTLFSKGELCALVQRDGQLRLARAPPNPQGS